LLVFVYFEKYKTQPLMLKILLAVLIKWVLVPEATCRGFLEVLLK